MKPHLEYVFFILNILLQGCVRLCWCFHRQSSVGHWTVNIGGVTDTCAGPIISNLVMNIIQSTLLVMVSLKTVRASIKNNNGWTPIYGDSEYKSRQHFIINNQNIFHHDSSLEKPRERTVRRKIFSFSGDANPISIPDSEFFKNLREFSSSIIDSHANYFVRIIQKIFGSRANVSYDPEVKMVSAFGLQFDIILALEQLFLTFTEFVAYTSTDIIFRILWPV